MNERWPFAICRHLVARLISPNHLFPRCSFRTRTHQKNLRPAVIPKSDGPKNVPWPLPNILVGSRQEALGDPDAALTPTMADGADEPVPDVVDPEPSAVVESPQTEEPPASIPPASDEAQPQVPTESAPPEEVPPPPAPNTKACTMVLQY